MSFTIVAGKKKITHKDTLVVFVDDKAKKITGPEGVEIGSEELSFFTGKAGEIYHHVKKGKASVIVCGLGDVSAIDEEVLRISASSVTGYCSSKKIKSIVLEIPSLKKLSEEDTSRYLAEGILLSNYAFTKYKSEVENTLLEKILFLSSSSKVKSSFSELETLIKNVYLCRDLVNDNADAVNPVYFADLAKKTAGKDSSLKATILDKKGIVKNKMGLIEAVNRSSKIEPRVVVLEYKGDPRDKKVIGLIGKGITYDSGGLNLKPGDSMLTMRCDMGGAATVFAAIKSIAELKLKKNVTAIIPLSENMLGGDSYKPGDIYTSHSGKTVEIGNTDAEGRLILADAISYMKSKYKPSMIIDVATLTGACVVTFGETVAAYLSNSEKIGENFEDSSKVTGEKVWRLPLFKDYDDRMNSEIADLSNMSSEKNAGTISAAVFLRHFIGDTDWLHLDIAGTAFFSKKRGYLPKNATGFGVRTLVDFVKNWK